LDEDVGVIFCKAICEELLTKFLIDPGETGLFGLEFDVTAVAAVVVVVPDEDVVLLETEGCAAWLALPFVGPVEVAACVKEGLETMFQCGSVRVGLIGAVLWTGDIDEGELVMLSGESKIRVDFSCSHFRIFGHPPPSDFCADLFGEDEDEESGGVWAINFWWIEFPELGAKFGRSGERAAGEVLDRWSVREGRAVLEEFLGELVLGNKENAGDFVG